MRSVATHGKCFGARCYEPGYSGNLMLTLAVPPPWKFESISSEVLGRGDQGLRRFLALDSPSTARRDVRR